MIESKKEFSIIVAAFLLTLFVGAFSLGQVDTTLNTDSTIEPDIIAPVKESAQMVLSDTGTDFELYRDRILDIFNMTMDDYNALNEYDIGRVHTYVFALWGYENGSLTLEEATELITPNSPETWFDVIFAWPQSGNLETTDGYFSIDFKSRAPWAERITKVEVYLDSNDDLSVKDPSASTVQKLTISEMSDPWNKGHIDSTGAWVAHEWWDGFWPWPYLGMSFEAHIPISDYCEFRAYGTPGYLDSSVKFFIRYEYHFYDIWLARWIVCSPYSVAYNKHGILPLFDIEIEDDDTRAPVIDEGSILQGYLSDDGFVATSTIYDNELIYWIEADVDEWANADWTSGIHRLNIDVNEWSYNIRSPTIIDGLEWTLFGNLSGFVGAYHVWHNTVFREQYKIYISLFIPGYTWGLGEHSVTITVTDNDNDRLLDRLTSSPVIVNFEVIDDDTTPPEVTVSAGTPYFSPTENQIMVPITVDASDESDIAIVGISVDLGNMIFFEEPGTYDIPITPGTHILIIGVMDNDNDRANDRLVTFKVINVNADSTPPVSMHHSFGTMGLGGWYTSSVTVTFTATDDMSGVDRIEYSYDCITWTTYDENDPPVITTQGTTTIYYRAVDTLGNTEEANPLVIMIDSIAPSSSISLSGTEGDNGWYVSSVLATISASDSSGGSGISTFYYQIGDAISESYTGPFEISNEGVITVSWFVIDHAGNTEGLKSIEVAIDTIPPNTEVSLFGEVGNDGWYRSDVEVTLIPYDGESGSGVYMTYYRVDDQDWVVYSMPFMVSGDGGHIVKFYSIDKAGNTEFEDSMLINIDTTDPVTTATLDGIAGLDGWYVSDVIVTLNVIEDGSGLLRTEYSLDESIWLVYSDPFVIPFREVTPVYYRSIDVAGNVEDTNTIYVRIYIEANADMDPDRLNLKSVGNWVTVYIELPEGYNPSAIDVTSIEIRLGDQFLPASWGEVQGDLLMVKFNRSLLVDMIGEVSGLTEIEFQIWGEICGMVFATTATIEVK